MKNTHLRSESGLPRRSGSRTGLRRQDARNWGNAYSTHSRTSTDCTTALGFLENTSTFALPFHLMRPKRMLCRFLVLMTTIESRT